MIAWRSRSQVHLLIFSALRLGNELSYLRDRNLFLFLFNIRFTLMTRQSRK